MRIRTLQPLMALLCILSIHSKAQIDTTSNNAGIWSYMGPALSRPLHPEMNGRLANFRWADLEPAPNVWDWSEFDNELTEKAADSLPIIFMVYTKEDAPDWLFTNGVPKVTEKDNAGNVIGYSPYYANTDYKTYFKRMVTTISKHIKMLPANVRNKIIGVQGCYGSTGDYISYKGNVASQYELTSTDFYDLFTEFSTDYYDEYKTTNPSIRLLSNPPNGGTDGMSGFDQVYWLTMNCPGGWLKNGTLGKGYQLNDEKTKAGWLFPIMNSPQTGGSYVRTRSELQGMGIVSGWWTEDPYRNMFALLTYALHWGLDWSNQNGDDLEDPLFDSSFNFFNKYAGQKDPAKSLNAMCALKDVIDASDVVRFPVSLYGTADRTTTRMQKVLAPFIPYGAKLEDPYTATLSGYDNLSATGINDAGWDLFPGNYERYLHQINANTTSAGYWNVQSADPGTMYGRFARGFDIAKGKDALYFDVDNAFLRNTALNSEYPVMMEVTYLDKGTGKFQLSYDAQDNSNKASITITCANTGLWKKAGVTLSDAYFGNRGTNGSDFYIKSIGSENVIFAVVELTRPQSNNKPVITGTSLSFDPICVNSTSDVKTFMVSGSFLNGKRILVGPLKGFSFSLAQDSAYSDSIRIKGYGASFSKTIYVKFNPKEQGSYDGLIPMKGGGAGKCYSAITASALNGAALSANVTGISCYNAKNGSIDLTQTGGVDPVTYSWTSIDGFRASTQDISSLKPSTYTVAVKSAGGCDATATYVVAQPDVLTVNLSADPMTCKGGTTTLYVAATGGTQPYSGTGSFTVSSGYKSYTVTDAYGCSDHTGISVVNGTQTVPSKPTDITGENADAKGLCGGGDFTYSVSKVSTATSYAWTPPAGCTVSNANSDGSNIILHAPANFNSGTLSVKAVNICGSSNMAETKSLIDIPDRPGTVTGPTSAKSNQAGLRYSVPAVAGLTYIWTVPGRAAITSGQNTPNITVTWGTIAGNVAVTASNNCGSSTYKSALYVNMAAGFELRSLSEDQAQITDATIKNTIIYPNPAKDFATLSFNSAKQFNYNVEVYDIAGKPMLHKSGVAQKGTNNVIIHVGQFAPGTYVVTFKNAKDEVRTLKLIKE